MSAHDSPSSRVRDQLETQGHAVSTIEWLPGDVSPRRYGRVTLRTGRGAIVAVYPEEIRETLARFRSAHALLTNAGIRVPAVLGEDEAAGWMLVEDLGPRTVFDLAGLDPEPTWPELRSYYRDALHQIDRVQALPKAAVSGLNPPMDGPFLRAELEKTWDAFLIPHKLVEPPHAEDFRSALGHLCDALTATPLVPCHRDFMVRNLVPQEGGTVAVLDFQDLRLGPVAYDLASLLNDSLFPPTTVVTELIADRIATPSARLAYHRAGAQRTLKALGTFALCAARGSRTHDGLIPPTLARALEHLAGAPETAAVVDSFRTACRARGLVAA